MENVTFSLNSDEYYQAITIRWISEFKSYLMVAAIVTIGALIFELISFYIHHSYYDEINIFYDLTRYLTFLIMLIGLYYLYSRYIGKRLRSRRAIHQNHFFYNDVVFSWNDTFFEMDTTSYHIHFSWNDVIDTAENNDIFCVFMGSSSFIALPKRAFSSKISERFSQLLQKLRQSSTRSANRSIIGIFD